MLPSRSFLASLREFYSPAEHGQRAEAIEAAIERNWRQVGSETRMCELDRTLVEGTLKVAVTQEGRQMAVHDLATGQYYVGRYEACQIVLAESSVSRVHCLLTVHADGFMTLCDLWSHNHVAVNGCTIPPGQSVRLRRGDSIWLGGVTLSIYCE